MADTKLTGLSAIGTLGADDILYVVDDPGGSPLSRKVTAGAVATYVQSTIGSRGTSQETTGNATDSLYGKVVTASATPHTKGSYTELVASTAFAAETMVLSIVLGTALSSTNATCLLDIAFGAASSEVVKVANMNLGHSRSGMAYTIPFAVPAGTRISARIQSTVASQAITVGVCLLQAGSHSAAPTSSVTYNADTTTSSATTVMTVIGAINTEGAWTQLAASTSADIRYLLVMPSGANAASQQAGDNLIDIGTGAEGVETAIITNIGVQTNATETPLVFGTAQPFTVSIPSGTRLSARYQGTNTATGARPCVILIGFN